MGYTPHFWGQVNLRPALDKAGRTLLRELGARDHRDGSTPGIWCGWAPTEAGDALIWNRREKFYQAEKWMSHLIDRFLAAKHAANGVVFAYAEPEGPGYFDVWRMDVVDSVVSVGGYEVPVLDFDEKTEGFVDQIRIRSAIDRYAARPDVGAGAIEQQILLIHGQLGQPAVAEALARFLHDAAAVLPEPARLRAVVGPFIAPNRQGAA